MKHTKLLLILILMFSCSLNEDEKIINEIKTPSENGETSEKLTLYNDLEEIRKLIREVYKWQDTQSPTSNSMIADDNDSIYIGFDIEQLNTDIEKLKSTNLFSEAFIDNYNRIFITLDEKLRNNEFEWFVGYLPPFGNDANPWCNCQDVPYDSPSPWEMLEIELINLDSTQGEFLWKWGKLELNDGEGWKDFTYIFRTVKENNTWKISYLEGFDIDEFTRINY